MNLFEPLQLGEISLPNRVIMAPLTRCRADEGRVPNDLMREYYQQRASAGLILTEATVVSQQGAGYVNTPGIWNAQQVKAWKRITDAVHARGGRIVCQLWHVGRLSHPDFQPEGGVPVAPSAIAAGGEIRVPSGHKPYPTPHPLSIEEIDGIVEDYRRGAQNAMAAGFDGVEIHGANGYLPDQFLRDGSNERTDEYGGSVQNRARFLLRVTDAAISVWGAGRVGVHLSPRDMEHHSIADSDPATLYTHVARELSQRNIAFIFVRESIEGGPRFAPSMRAAFNGGFILNEQFTPEQAEQTLGAGEADAISWGQLFIANPDLPERLASGAPLNAPVPATFYAPGALGYTDYPFLDGTTSVQEHDRNLVTA